MKTNQPLHRKRQGLSTSNTNITKKQSRETGCCSLYLTHVLWFGFAFCFSSFTMYLATVLRTMWRPLSSKSLLRDIIGAMIDTTKLKRSKTRKNWNLKWQTTQATILEENSSKTIWEISRTGSKKRETRVSRRNTNNMIEKRASPPLDNPNNMSDEGY